MIIGSDGGCSVARQTGLAGLFCRHRSNADHEIPLTLHIIFRSGGLCVSMLTGRLIGGKKYTIGQAVRPLHFLPALEINLDIYHYTKRADSQVAGVIITAGIVLATLSAPSRRSSPPAATTHAALGGEGSAALAATDTADTAQFLSGIAMLCTALVLSALLGLWQERIYALYGTVWQEGLFYSVCPVPPADRLKRVVSDDG